VELTVRRWLPGVLIAVLFALAVVIVVYVITQPGP
jgi:hypothetical protein